MNMRKPVICTLLLAGLIGPFAAYGAEKSAAPQQATQPQPAPEKWFDVTHMDQTFLEEKQEIVLTAEAAARLFTKDAPHFVADWREKLGQEIETRPDAIHLDEKVSKTMLKREGTPYAAVRAFSKQHLQVMVIKPIGQYLWHHFYECQANFKLPRNAAVDALFDVPALERVYAATVKGIGYGDSAETVVKALGEPDSIQTYQAIGLERYAYFEDDVVILFEYSRVKTITPGVAPELKKEVAEKGKHIVRF